GQVAAIAERAHAALALAAEHGTDADPVDARGLDRVGRLLGDLVVDAHDHGAAERVLHVLQAHTADDTVAQGLDHLARLDDRADVDAVHGAAVVVADDHVLAN